MWKVPGILAVAIAGLHLRSSEMPLSSIFDNSHETASIEPGAVSASSDGFDVLMHVLTVDDVVVMLTLKAWKLVVIG